jgi:hypothetical protein
VRRLSLDAMRVLVLMSCGSLEHSARAPRTRTEGAADLACAAAAARACERP